MDKKHIVESWIIFNIKRHHNSLVPDKYIEKFGIDGTEVLLTDLIGEKVSIRTATLAPIRDEVYGFYTSQQTMYIAEAFNF